MISRLKSLPNVLWGGLLLAVLFFIFLLPNPQSSSPAVVTGGERAEWKNEVRENQIYFHTRNCSVQLYVGGKVRLESTASFAPLARVGYPAWRVPRTHVIEITRRDNHNVVDQFYIIHWPNNNPGDLSTDEYVHSAGPDIFGKQCGAALKRLATVFTADQRSLFSGRYDVW